MAWNISSTFSEKQSSKKLQFLKISYDKLVQEFYFWETFH